MSFAIPNSEEELKERTKRSREHYDRGISYYMHHQFNEARQEYRKAVQLLEFVMDPKVVDKDILQKLNLTEFTLFQVKKKMSIYCNKCAHCDLKLNDENECIKSCTLALEFYKTNAKGLHLRSRAYRRLSQFEEALKDIDDALKLEPNNKEFRDEKELILQKSSEPDKIYSSPRHGVSFQIHGDNSVHPSEGNHFMDGRRMRFFSSSLPEDDETNLDNLKFYSNDISSKPKGDFIDVIHKKWFGNWDLLEDHHSYIQWLFPIREGGLNGAAQPLSKYEASMFRKSPEIQRRLIKSYEMMLDFYGLILKDKSTGEIARNPTYYKNRYRHLNFSFHNYLRITRILKCLGINGLEHYKKPFLTHMTFEIFKHKHLHHAAESCLKYWIPTLRRKEDIAAIDQLISGISGDSVNRQLYGNGDEEGVNWSTQYYPPECNIIHVYSPNNGNLHTSTITTASATTTTGSNSTASDNTENMKEIKTTVCDDENSATSQSTQDDVYTYPEDPFEQIHQLFSHTPSYTDNPHQFMHIFGGIPSIMTGGKRGSLPSEFSTATKVIEISEENQNALKEQAQKYLRFLNNKQQ